MRLIDLTPMLQSADLDRTEAWYRDVLGFARAGRAEGWLRMERDGVALMFMTNAHVGEPAATAVQYIRVDDALSLWDDLRDKVGAEWGPEDFDYGMREFAIRDPDGYLLSFGQDLEAATADATKG
ncbi:MAG: VOC family protein [Rhodobacteraceae bacterium]|nr:VOC family protein [Paracoccaceae bacterium]